MPSKDLKLSPSRTDVNSIEPDSLWKIIGQSKALSLVKCVIEQYHIDVMDGRNPKLPSLLITGESGMGKSLLAKAISNAFGCLDVRIGYGNCLGFGDDVCEYFLGGNENTCYYIRYAEQLNQFAQNTIMKLLLEDVLHITNPLEQTSSQEEFPNRLIIFSAASTKRILSQIVSAVDINLSLTPYSNEEISQIIYQRCWMLDWACSDEAMKFIGFHAQGNVGKSMRILQMTYRVARARGEDYLRLADATQALIYTSKPCINKNDSQAQ